MEQTNMSSSGASASASKGKKSNKSSGNKPKSKAPSILLKAMKEASERTEKAKQEDEENRLREEQFRLQEEEKRLELEKEAEKKRQKRKQAQNNQKKNRQNRASQLAMERLGIDPNAIHARVEKAKKVKHTSSSITTSSSPSNEGNVKKEQQPQEEKSEVASDWEDMADCPELWKVDENGKTIWHTDDKLAPTRAEFKAYKEKRAFEQSQILEESEKENVPKEAKKEVKKEVKKEPEVILKAPVVCVLGNVDAGKTSILDKIKKTNVQDGEAGGITQSISSIWVSAKNSKTGLPGALIIDTPGHDSFEHLRELGAQVCNFVILMVDINESLKQQTIRAIQIVKKNRIPFVVALNKVDRIFGWKSPEKPTPFKKILESQDSNTQRYFYERISELNCQMAENSFNSCLYFHNDDPKKQVSLVPVSARTGDGVPDLLNLVLTLSHKFMLPQLTYNPEKPEGVVLGYETLKGFGSSLDLILTNGEIKPRNKILVETINGVEEHEINMILSAGSQKGKYRSERTLQATQNCKVVIKTLNLNTVILGRPIHWIDSSWNKTTVQEFSETASQELNKIIDDFTPNLSKYGVSVHSSSFGGLRAITNFLEEHGIPYFRAKVGKVKKTDLTSTEGINKKMNQKNFYNILVGFDVDFEFDLNNKEINEKVSTLVLTDNIIYSLYDKISKHVESQRQGYLDSFHAKVPYPVEIAVIDHDHVFANKNPILVGVRVLTGILKVGTPLMALDKNSNTHLNIGMVTGIKSRKQLSVQEANEKEEVSVRIEPLEGFTIRQIDRDFAWDSRIMTHYSKELYQMGQDYLYSTYPDKVKPLYDELGGYLG